MTFATLHCLPEAGPQVPLGRRTNQVHDQWKQIYCGPRSWRSCTNVDVTSGVWSRVQVTSHRGADLCRALQTACTPCRLCRLFKTFKTTKNKTLEFRSREVEDEIRLFKQIGIQKEPVQLGKNCEVFNVWKSVHAPKKGVQMVCIHPKQKVCIMCACFLSPSICLMMSSMEQV